MDESKVFLNTLWKLLEEYRSDKLNSEELYKEIKSRMERIIKKERGERKIIQIAIAPAQSEGVKIYGLWSDNTITEIIPQ